MPAMRHQLVTVVCLTLLTCTSQSPFTRPPAAVAVDEPCRFMGTVHKESRQRLEVLRACGAISMEEWSCMASVLKSLDTEFTALCRSRSVAYQEIAARQRSLYSDCVSRPKAETVECGLLSEDARCLAERCR